MSECIWHLGASVCGYVSDRKLVSLCTCLVGVQNLDLVNVVFVHVSVEVQNLDLLNFVFAVICIESIFGSMIGLLFRCCLDHHGDSEYARSCRPCR